MRDLLNTDGKMTSLVIAEITGKQHKDVMRSIRKMEDAWLEIGQRKFALISYIDSRNRAMPMFELTKTECLYIATKFNDTARAKLVLRWQQLEEQRQNPMSELDMVEASIRAIRAQEREMAAVKEDIKLLQAKVTTRPDFFTIAGYGSLHGVPVNIKVASRLGRQASKLCKDRGLSTDTIPDPRFGTVKMYPTSVLDEVFNELRLSEAS